jgi:hypothetical protein
MKRMFRLIVISLLCVCLLPVNTPAKADSLQTAATEIIVAIAATGVVVGVLIYYALSRPPSITGCAVTGLNGLELQNEGDGKTFQLLGITSDVKPGDRVRVRGKKKSVAKNSSGNPTFLVDKLTKDYGACKVVAAKP